MLKRKPQYYIFIIWNMIIGKFHTIRNLLLLNYWGVKTGNSISLFGSIKVLNMNVIVIGDRVRVLSGYSNMVGGECKTAFYTGQQGKIIIGNDVGISNATLISQCEICIDDKVFIGGGCKIYDNDFHAIQPEARFNRPLEIPAKPIRICKGAFIGGHSIILKGVTIGEFAVVGAGSVVVKDIPAGEVWGGSPAKKLKNVGD